MSFAREQLQEGEEIVLQANPHVVVLFKPIMITLAALVVISTIFVLGRRSSEAVYWLWIALIPFLIYLSGEFLVRINEEYIITTCRVVKQEGVFNKNSFDAPLDKINNIFHTQTFLGRLFDYGNVGLETASEIGLTNFEYIPDPIGFKNALITEREKYKERERPTQHPPSIEPPSYTGKKEDVPELLERLAKLRDSKVITEEEFQESKRKLLGKL